MGGVRMEDKRMDKQVMNKWRIDNQVMDNHEMYSWGMDTWKMNDWGLDHQGLDNKGFNDHEWKKCCLENYTKNILDDKMVTNQNFSMQRNIPHQHKKNCFALLWNDHSDEIC